MANACVLRMRRVRVYGLRTLGTARAIENVHRRVQRGNERNETVSAEKPFADGACQELHGRVELIDRKKQ